MNKLIADFTVLYTKLHTYHYNVVGPEFYSLHVMLEKEYDTFHEWIDEAAESMKVDGEYPVATVKEMLEITSIKEAESRDYSSKEILEDLVSDYENLIAYMYEIKETLPMIQDNMLEEFITYLQKQIWFFKATLK
ncbi:DNA starvation/stationary phase protection protein [Mollicutes bacterium LVI A0078]|nr:DNA starvation/stationary phase protection protein [Mollicutes bacterium LVI A0075]WOO91484.1 DNA starvation/stationary phase protection protein [Mollicutes bacterium LVI A0078]